MKTKKMSKEEALDWIRSQLQTSSEDILAKAKDLSSEVSGKKGEKK